MRILLVALMLAGCAAPAVDDVDEVPDEAAPAGAQPPEVLDISLSGSLGISAYACAAMRCAGHAFPDSSQQALEMAAPVQGIDLRLEWTAQNELMRELRFGLSWNETGSHDFRFADGPSPLYLSVPDRILPTEAPYIWVLVPEAAGVLPVYITTDQDFRVVGNATVA